MRVASAAVILAAAGAPLRAEEAAVAQETNPVLEVEAPFASGLKVAIDARTGKLRQPTAAEAKQLAEAFLARFGKRAGEEMPLVQHKSGMLSTVLTLDSLDFAMATIDASGKATFSCVDSPQAAAEILANGSTLEKE